MGTAEIIDGGPDGRYTIRLDFGESERIALIDAFTQAVAQLDIKIATSELAMAEADAREQAQLDTLKLYADQYAFASQQDPPDLPTMDGLLFVYTEGLKQLRNIQTGNAPIRIADRKLRDGKAAYVKQIAYYNAVDALEERQAWCCDFTEDAGFYVATVDIPGENNLILIAPGGREPNASDGELAARELMSPSQAYFNAAILPGWQKDKPTYRWGTVTFLDEETDLASVDLFDSTSSAQGLSVNQSPSLNGIPVQYMGCNAKVFKVGDRVVVQFANQNWEDPRVIGFVDTPRGCPPEFVPAAFTGNEGVGNGRPFSKDYKSYWINGWKPVTYSVQEGALPAGITLDPLTGVMSGTSTETGPHPGIVLRCTDKAEKYDDTFPFGFDVTPPFLELDCGTSFVHANAHTNVTQSGWCMGRIAVSATRVLIADSVTTGMEPGLTITIQIFPHKTEEPMQSEIVHYYFRGDPYGNPYYDKDLYGRISFEWFIGDEGDPAPLVNPYPFWYGLNGLPSCAYEFGIATPDFYWSGDNYYAYGTDYQSFRWWIDIGIDPEEGQQGDATIIHTVRGNGVMTRECLNEFFR